METVRLILQILLLVFAVLMIIVVLMQSSRSSGLGSAFGGDSNPSSLGGARGRAASKEAKLKKLTIIIAIVLGVLSIAMVILSA